VVESVVTGVVQPVVDTAMPTTASASTGRPAAEASRPAARRAPRPPRAMHPHAAYVGFPPCDATTQARGASDVGEHPIATPRQAKHRSGGGPVPAPVVPTAPAPGGSTGLSPLFGLLPAAAFTGPVGRTVPRLDNRLPALQSPSFEPGFSPD
jgi:hypothetical protein